MFRFYSAVLIKFVLEDVFLAVQNSSIGDLVTNSLTHSMAKGTFSFDIQRATLETCEF